MIGVAYPLAVLRLDTPLVLVIELHVLWVQQLCICYLQRHRHLCTSILASVAASKYLMYIVKLIFENLVVNDQAKSSTLNSEI